MTYTTINLNTDSDIATISLNRPDVRNAMNEIMMQEITTAFHSVGKDSSIRIVVLNGHGKSFCSGADLNMMKNSIAKTSAENKAETLLLAKIYRFSLQYRDRSLPGLILLKLHLMKTWFFLLQ